MDKLPDDIIYEIFNRLDIDSFFATRQTCKRIYDTTNARLTSVVVAVARTTFPDQTRILVRRPDQKADIAWLNDLRYQQLAAILLECVPWKTQLGFRMHSSPAAYYLDDECPEGDYLRRKIVLGFRVIAELARMARQVSALPIESLKPRKEPTWRIQSIDTICLRCALQEEVLFDRCQDFICQMSAEDLQGLGNVLDGLLGYDIFQHKRIRLDRPITVVTEEPEAWLVWKLIKMGPKSFWDIWWASRDAASPHLNASRLVLQSQVAYNHRVVRFIEAKRFNEIVEHTAETKHRRKLKSILGAPNDNGQFPFSVQTPNSRLFELLANRIRPLHRMRTLWQPDEAPIRNVLFHSVPFHQFFVWDGLDVVDDPTADFPSPKLLAYERRSANPAEADRYRVDYSNALVFQDQEQKWLDWERDFGRAPLDPVARNARARQKLAEMDPSDLNILADERGTDQQEGVWSKLKNALKIRSRRRSLLD